ncbi:MAG TPA: cardiolipin synthase, partial [Chthoniobacteraceae bacterium]|nr:cardiolipin synthase [Chthoniobacteraceae bacterium]
YAGTFFYFVFGTDRLVRQKLRATREMDASGGRAERRVDADTRASLEPLSPQGRQAVELLSRLHEYAISCADEARLLIDGGAFFAALGQRIDQARHHVHIEFYIWQNDARANDMLDRLVTAARRGVEVRLLLDPIGCFGLRRSHFAPLTKAGGKFAWFRTAHPLRNQWTFTLRNHRKLQIIDCARCFVGGMNMGREYAGEDPAIGPWRDIQIEIVGNAARKFQMIFADDWFFATQEKLLAPHYYPPPQPSQKLLVQAMTDGPDDPGDPIEMSLVWMLNIARHRVWLTAGYFGPNEPLLSALQLAAARGVDVRMLVAGKSDHPLLVNIGRSYYEELLRYGVKIYEYEAGINHGKVALIDEEWLMVGSANLDTRSMRLNFELNALVRDPATAADLERVLSRDFESSNRIVADEFVRRSRWQRWKESLVRPLAPLM